MSELPDVPTTPENPAGLVDRSLLMYNSGLNADGTVKELGVSSKRLLALMKVVMRRMSGEPPEKEKRP